jgi:hypothetical protein
VQRVLPDATNLRRTTRITNRTPLSAAFKPPSWSAISAVQVQCRSESLKQQSIFLEFLKTANERLVHQTPPNLYLGGAMLRLGLEGYNSDDDKGDGFFKATYQILHREAHARCNLHNAVIRWHMSVKSRSLRRRSSSRHTTKKETADRSTHLEWLL